jgi:hypothetical protein
MKLQHAAVSSEIIVSELTTKLCKNFKVYKIKKGNQQRDITCIRPLKRMLPAADGDGGRTVRVPILIRTRVTDAAASR